MAGFSERLDFPGHDGSRLAGRLELPPGTPRAYALFAHCFTCSKDIFAASPHRRGPGRARHRGAALRLHRARRERGRVRQHQLLLQHRPTSSRRRTTCARRARRRRCSSAIRSAARRCWLRHGDIPEARGGRHHRRAGGRGARLKNFAADVGRIEATGAAEVTLAGRKFTIRRQFLEDAGGRTARGAHRRAEAGRS